MNQNRFDEITVAVAGGETRRTVLRKVFGGSLAALLATVGIAAGDDKAAAKSCAKKCNQKKSKKARRKCRQRCPNFLQQGSAFLESQSAPNCADLGECVDAVDGTVTGTPIAAGAFGGELTGTNFRPGSAPDTIDVDFAGTLTATETATGDELAVVVDLVLTQNQETRAFTFSGTYQLDGGTGRFAGATGDGTVTGNGTRAEDGQSGEVEEFALEGKIDLA